LKPGQDKTKEFRGSEVLTLHREWVQDARKLLRWGSLAAYAAATGGAGAVGGLVTMAGGVISQDDASKLAAEYAQQREAFEDFASAIPDASEHILRDRKNRPAGDKEEDFSNLWLKGFGKPEEGDLKLIRFLREEFRKLDPTWGGLVPRADGKFGRIWAHPKSNPFDQH
jgi:hypothetical protein